MSYYIYVGQIMEIYKVRYIEMPRNQTRGTIQKSRSKRQDNWIRCNNEYTSKCTGLRIIANKMFLVDEYLQRLRIYEVITHFYSVFIYINDAKP